MTPKRSDPIAGRQEFGKSLRHRVPRAAQGELPPPRERPDALKLLKQLEKGRVRELLSIKYGRMIASPFAYFRGAAPSMAADLAALPYTGLSVQICGDAHVRNLGAYAAPDGHLTFDVNDFDETVRGPWEWDLKRLASSLVLAGRQAGDPDGRCRQAVRAFTRAYREMLLALERLPAVDLARYEIRREFEKGPVHEILRRAQRATPQELLSRLTTGSLQRFRNRPPLLRRWTGRTAAEIVRSLSRYRNTLPPARRQILDAYRPVDVAFKVVGTGSVGTKDYVVLCFGFGPEDPLFLQLKQELPSCYRPYLPAPASVGHEGQRVAEGQLCFQTVTDPFLGWTTIGEDHFVVRQLADHKATLDTQQLSGPNLLAYAAVCGEILAKGHARTGDPAALSGYVGRQDKLDRALARFAMGYADVVESDYAAFRRAVRSGQFNAAR